MEGQWLGDTQSGDTIGHVILDVDELPDGYGGTARLFAPGEPGIICGLQVGKHQPFVELHDVPLSWMPEGEPLVIDREAVCQRYPNFTFPQSASITLEQDGDSLQARWRTDIGTSGEALLKRSRPDFPSAIEPLPDVRDWEAFKRFAVSQKPGRYIFRGQPEAFRLRTSFHRSFRKDLVKYTAQDIPLAYKTLIARTKHIFDLNRPDQRGAFWNLLQHHGYPTPLLDWTYSPFVAAFFAFRRRQSDHAPSDNVRIYIFDKESWTSRFRQLDAVNFAELHFSILDALAIENARAIPQQALSTLTNADDVESYIHLREIEAGASFLHAVDLPAAHRREIMTELSLMGITAGSLFPGLDGACEELRGRMFHHQW